MHKHICLYHSADLDGHCSGAIYSQYHTRKGIEYELYPIDYGDLIPWDNLKDAHITLIDFSLQPWSEFIKLIEVAKSVVWIDHHKSAINDYIKWIGKSTQKEINKLQKFDNLLNTKKAACELAWKHYNLDEEMPLAVRLLGRYDVWDHSDEKVLPFQYGMRMLDLDPLNGKDKECWNNTFLHNSEHIYSHNCGENITCVYDIIIDIVHDGQNILDYQEKQNAEAIKEWFPLNFANRQWQAYNRINKGSSIFKSIWNPRNFDGMLSFGWTGKMWKIGLFSDKEDVDCGEIAKQNGGGGHKGAAGFQCDKLPFEIGN